MRRALLLLPLAALACRRPPAYTAPSYYDRAIAPIFFASCQRGTTGCHQGDFPNGNLDLTSRDALLRRRDVVFPYGSYPSLLLLKAGPPVDLPNGAGTLRSRIAHAGGPVLDPSSDAYRTLARWIEAGAPEDLPAPPPQAAATPGGCVSAVPAGADVSAVDWSQPGPAAFKSAAFPRFKASCAAASCHGGATSGPRSDFDLTCGDDDAQLSAAYHSALQFWKSPAAQSALLLKPLAGGPFHTGGKPWASVQDPAYKDVERWLEAEPEPPAQSLPPLVQEYADTVQPALVSLGCFLAGCHGPAAPSDLHLAAPSPDGTFSAKKTQRNFDALMDFVDANASDPDRTRLMAKLVPLSAGGILHRGGKLLPFAGDPDRQAIEKWIGDLRAASGASRLQGVVWLERPPGDFGPRDAATFHPGGDLHYALATLDANGRLTGLSGDVNLTASVHAAGAELRDPAVRWDGRAVAFAMRASDSDCLNVYEIDLDPLSPQPAGTTRELTGATGCSGEAGPHAFMPAYLPDGSLVYASTRGLGNAPRDGAYHPQADLFVKDAGSSAPRALAWTPNDDLLPSFDPSFGRVLFSTVKSFGDFLQVAARRVNADSTDFHPLFANHQNLGFSAAWGVRTMADGDFVATMADAQGHFGAGTIGITNRSIGPDDTARQGDPDPFFLHGFSVPVPGATGRGASPGGAFRDVAPLPDGNLVASCDLGAVDLSSGASPPAFGLCLVDLSDRTAAPAPVTTLRAFNGSWRVSPQPVYAHAARRIYTLANLGRDAMGTPGAIAANGPAEVTFLDLGPLGSLFDDNLRSGGPGNPGRDVPDAQSVRVVLEDPAPAGATALANDPLCPATGCGKTSALGFAPRSVLAEAPVNGDGSVKLALPSDRAFSLQLLDGSGLAVKVQTEALFSPPGQFHAFSVPRRFFDGFCGSCHGALSGRETETGVNPDAVTGASQVMATLPGERAADATQLPGASLDFERDVKPLVLASCATGGCHDATAAGGLRLTDGAAGNWSAPYAALLARASAQDVAAGRFSGCGYDGTCRKYVDPRALARRSYLAEVAFGRELDAPWKLSHPKTGLSEADAKTIARWIELGAPFSDTP